MTLPSLVLSPPQPSRSLSTFPSSPGRVKPVPSRSFRQRRAPQSPRSENVQVAVRCRPLMQHEWMGRAENSNCWHVKPQIGQIGLAEHASNRPARSASAHEYNFDHVFQGSDNDKLYHASIKQLIHHAMDGYNATVFAYGQTASGKTYTMMGNEQEPGVIPRAVHDVFEYIKDAVTTEFLLRVSYLEIYNETIRDLLAPHNNNLKIHEDKQRGVYVAPLTEEIVTSPSGVLSIIRKGEANRHISTTDYNLHSSRSHTIFQMVIESRERTNPSMGTTRRPMTPSRSLESVKISQLNLIDLAGSEKAVSNAERRMEGSFINKSLLTLGTVISKLTESGKHAGHIPYRDSKLTRILQTSLSGMAKVVVICTISPTIDCIEESTNTLKFAARAKKIVVSATNEAVLDDKALIQKYKSEIQDLKFKLQTANDVMQQEKQQTETKLTVERKQHEQQIGQMRMVRRALKDRIDELTRLILNSATVSVPPDSPRKASPPELGANEAWSLVRDLRKEIDTLKVDNASLTKQVEEKKQQAELDAKIKKELTDKVAHLEAELSVTKAELQVASIIAKEKSSDAQRITWDLSALNLTNGSR